MGLTPVLLLFIIALVFAGVMGWTSYKHTGILRDGQLVIAAKQIEIDDNLKTVIHALEIEKTALHEAYENTIAGWARALEMRDHDTHGHSERVTTLTVALAEMMGIRNGEILKIKRGALLHDIGKMGIPDAILLKPDRLTPEEYEVMQGHPQAAYDMLYSITFLRPSLDIPFCHHERWDGSGYPRRLKGNQIPMAARIFSVVDVYDALTSTRPYRTAMSKIEALNHIQKESGSMFDPNVVAVFISMMEKRI